MMVPQDRWEGRPKKAAPFHLGEPLGWESRTQAVNHEQIRASFQKYF